MTQGETGQPEFRLEDLRPMESPGYAFETICDPTRDNRVVIGIQQSWLQPLAENVYEVTLQSNRGLCQAILTVAQGKPGVVLWIPGQGENLNGPAGGVYAELAPELMAADISSLRMGYRDPNSQEESALDVFMWLCFLKGVGAKQAVLVGNALGATAAIPAAIVDPMVRALAVISSQEEGTEKIGEIAPKPVLIMHGEQDPRVPVDMARIIYQRANEPKELIIYPEGEFTLYPCRQEVQERLGDWAAEHLGASDAFKAAQEARDDSFPVMSRLVYPQEGGPPKEVLLTRDDIVEMDVDAIVSPTGTWLDMKHSILAGQIYDRGGSSIQDQLWGLAPLFVGDVGVTDAGSLKARHILHAITGGESAGDPLSRDEMVAMCTQRSLLEADSRGLKTIAIPAIGTGGRGFAMEKAAHIEVGVVATFLSGNTSLERVTIGVVTDGNYKAFEGQFKQIPE